MGAVKFREFKRVAEECLPIDEYSIPYRWSVNLAQLVLHAGWALPRPILKGIKEFDVMDIEQKVAVITGASRGLGAALVKAYRDRGYGYHRGLGLKAGKVLPRRLAGVRTPPRRICDR
jgi:hypothetical protein